MVWSEACLCWWECQRQGYEILSNQEAPVICILSWVLCASLAPLAEGNVSLSQIHLCSLLYLLAKKLRFPLTLKECISNHNK